MGGMCPRHQGINSSSHLGKHLGAKEPSWAMFQKEVAGVEKMAPALLPAWNTQERRLREEAIVIHRASKLTKLNNDELTGDDSSSRRARGNALMAQCAHHSFQGCRHFGQCAVQLQASALPVRPLFLSDSLAPTEPRESKGRLAVF